MHSYKIRRDLRFAIRDTTLVPVAVVLLLYGPCLVYQNRKTAYMKKRMTRIMTTCIVTYPLNILVAIPIEAAWLLSYPFRLSAKYSAIRRFFETLSTSPSGGGVADDQTHDNHLNNRARSSSAKRTLDMRP